MKEVIMSLYIIFFGIVPLVALIALWFWTRNGGKYKWKKGATSAYVSNLNCFKSRNTQPGGRAWGQCAWFRYKRNGNFLSALVPQFLVRQPKPKSTDDGRNRIFTISNNESDKQHLQITKTDIVWSTNPDVINGSSDIERRKSMLFNNPKVDFNNHQLESRTVSSSAMAKPIQSEVLNSQKRELGSIISGQIQNFQNKPVKNFKSLKVKTEFKFQHLNESPCSSSAVTPGTPGTADATVSNDTTQSKILFYNKKAPPPPAPSQSLKPKLWN